MSTNQNNQGNNNQQNQQQNGTNTSTTVVPQQQGVTANMLHSFRVFGSRFIISCRYKPIRGLGRGAYGICISALDTQDPNPNTRVAIKKIPRMFQDLVDAKRILREVKLLRHFDHPNIIRLRDLLPSYGEFEELYMVLDFMQTDLHKIIYSNNTITLDHVRFILYQMLSGLKYMHDCDVVHRDLKPSNILINDDTQLKICDFGLARGIQSESDYLTEYVVTRWYRAPEIMCSSEQYDYKIDLWSIGCILAELLNRNPLFAGNDYKQQLSLIFNTLGTPTQQDLAFVTNDYALQYIRSLPVRPKPTSLSSVVRCQDADCLDLLDKLLQFNPANRINVDDALQHPFLKPYYEHMQNHIFDSTNASILSLKQSQNLQSNPIPTDVTSLIKPQRFDDSFEQEMQDNVLTKVQIQQRLITEGLHYNPQLFKLYVNYYFPPQEVDKILTAHFGDNNNTNGNDQIGLNPNPTGSSTTITTSTTSTSATTTNDKNSGNTDNNNGNNNNNDTTTTSGRTSENNNITNNNNNNNNNNTNQKKDDALLSTNLIANSSTPYTVDTSAISRIAQ